MAKYQVIVSNVGTVYDGDSIIEANKEYAECVSLSKDSKFGRIAGESVTFFNDGEPTKEYIGKLHEND